ncbi:MAG: FtsX-like permease family protein, partial [Merdibacter sp.]
LLGTAAALGATALVMHLINALLQDLAIHLQLTLSVDPRLLAVTILIAFAAVWISAWRPARHAGTISAISAIRQSADITLPQRHSHNNPLVWRLFGYPAVLGLKNQKRFRSRHYAVLCSLVLSFALFVSIFALSSYLERSVQMVGEQLPFDAEVVYDKGSAQQLQESDALLQLPQADARMRMQRISLSLDDAALFTDELIAWQQQQGSMGLGAYVLSLDDASFSTLCRENGIDPSRSDAPIAFAVNVGSEQTSSAAHTYRQITFLKEDTHAVSLMNYEEQEISLSVAALLTTPYGLDAYGGSSLDSIAFYVSEATMTQNLRTAGAHTVRRALLYQLRHRCPDGHHRTICPSAPPTWSLTSASRASRKESHRPPLLLLVRLLLYAFLLLISIVALTNVCNTLSSSYALRAQENAMLFSIGMDKRQFHSMLTFEALSYAFKGAFYGLLLALPLCYLIYQILGMKFTFAFYVPLMPILIAIAALFLLTLFMLLYHLSLSRKETSSRPSVRESI